MGASSSPSSSSLSSPVVVERLPGVLLAERVVPPGELAAGEYAGLALHSTERGAFMTGSTGALSPSDSDSIGSPEAIESNGF